MTDDITKTGPVGLKGLKGIGQQQPEELSDYSKAIRGMSSKQLSHLFLPEAERDVGVQLGAFGYGKSMFDDAVQSVSQLEDIQDIRGQEQPWYAQVSAGLAKGVILAVTTFLDGTVGLVAGAHKAINEGKWSGLWDNDFSRTMKSINDWSEEALPNYYTRAELEQPWYNNIFTANFIGDKFIKNLGFTVGALYSGGAISGGIRGLGKLAISGGRRLGASVNTVKNVIPKVTSITATSVGVATSSLNEGRIEALNNSTDWFNYHKVQLDDSYGVIDGDTSHLTEEQLEDYNESLAKLSEDRVKMGNVDMLFNLPILMASNFIQFGRLFANGFKTSRKGFNIAGRLGEYTAGDTKKKLAPFVIKNALSEGTEEISQRAASEISGIYYSTDVNNFYKSKKDPEAALETLSWTKAFAQGINETVNDGSAWEEFFIGTLTGALGMPRFRSAVNKEGKFQSPITIYNEGVRKWREHNERVDRENEIVDRMNQRVNSPEFMNYYQGLIRHNKYQNDMNRAAIEGNEFDFKNAEHAQLISDIIMFDNAGKLEDLIEAINAASGTTREDLESIVTNTTAKDAKGDLIGPFSQYATTDDGGNIVANFGSQESADEMAAKIKSNKDDILNTVKQYQKIKDDLLLSFGDRLSNDQLEELTWMKSQIGNWAERTTAISGEVKSVIGDAIGNLSSLLEFYQSIRNFEGQHSAGLTDRYKQADENVRAIEGAINTLNLVRGQNDKALAYTLANNPKFVDGLIKEINEIDETVLGADKKEGIVTKLNDIVKLGNASRTYNAKLKEYLQNPQKQAEDHAKADEEAVKQEADKKSKTLRDKLNAAQNIKEFRAAIEEEEDTESRDNILSSMEDEGNEMAKNYRETSQYNSEVRRVLNGMDVEPQVKQDAMELFQSQFDNSENLEQLANPNSIYVNNANAFDEDSEGDVELSATRFQEAQYALQNAMSKVNNDNRFKDRFSPEYKKPVDNRRNTIVNRVTTKSGKTVEGTYTKTKDKDGFIHGKYSGPRIAKFRVTPSNTGLTLDELIGSKDEYQSEDNYNEVIEGINDGGLTIDGFTVRPDGSVSITTDNQITIEGKAAKEIYNQLFNPTIKGDDRTATGDSGTSTTPAVTSSGDLPTIELPVGNITAEMVNEENKKANERVETPQRPSRDTSNQFYRPAIPELHIEASKEGDFRPFDIVVGERQKGVDFSGIYGYLRDAGAFRYVNEGNLKVGDELGFMIDPDFNDHTIFIVDRKNNQIVGSLDESDYSVSRYEGLKGLEEKIRNEYSNRQNKTGKFIATPTTRVSKVMIGRVPYGSEERSLKDIPNVQGEGRQAVFGIVKNGTLTTNGKVDDSLIIKPVDMSQKEGRLYLLIPNGAGKYSPAAVRVKHFNNTEFSLDDVTVSSTPIGEDIKSAIEKLSNASSQDDVSAAMQELSQDLHMQDVMVSWFDGSAGSGIVISRKVKKPDGTYEKIIINDKEQIKEEKHDVYFSTSKKSVNIGGVNWDIAAAESEGDTSAFGAAKDPSSIYKEILDIITGFNLPLQVSVRRINDGAYNNRLINSDILTSNITDATVKSSWFTTDYFDSEGNLHKANSPASVIPQPKRKIETPVGGKEGAIVGTRIVSVFSNKAYYVDLKTNTIRDDQGRTVAVTDSNNILFDLAWAQDNFGDATVSSMMIDNKVLTPDGRVLDRGRQKYLEGKEAQDVKDAIAGRKKERENKIADSKKVISEIYENQKRVDKDRTDGEFYYILEDDGQYHEYSRVHSRLGSNWVESSKQTEVLTQVRTNLSRFTDNTTQFNNYLKFLENKYKISLDEYVNKTDAKSRDTIVNIVRDVMSGTNSQRALNAGTAVDSIIRQYFTLKDISKIERPSNMSESAFIDLITTLNNIKSNMEQMGERFLADNIVLFQKYPDGTRVAGEVDILSVDKDGNFRIYDVKTSRHSFYDFVDRHGNKVNYFNNKSNTQRISNKDYYTLQLSAYKNLFESQYGVPVTKLAIMPFVLSYDRENVSAVQSEKGILIAYNPAVNVPLVSAVKVDKSVETPATQAQAQTVLPIFETSLETQNPIEDLTPEHSMNNADETVGYFELDGKLHKGYVTALTVIDGVEIYVTKVPNITRGFGRETEVSHVASNSFYAVFPNGKTFLFLKNNPVQGGMTQSQVEDAIRRGLEAKPQKVKDFAAEKTILFNPNETPTVDSTPITNDETPATIHNTTTQSGAEYTAQREAMAKPKNSKFKRKLKLREASSKTEIWDQEKELAWLDKVLPQLSESTRNNIVKGLIRVADSGAVAWGQFNGNVITLSDVAAEGTTYHEAFHAVFNLLLSDAEKNSLLNEYRTKHTNMDDLQLEEELAEDFREFVMQGGKDTRSLGRKILDFFKSLFIKTKYWKDFRPSSIYYFRAINEGKYSGKDMSVTTISEARYRKIPSIAELRAQEKSAYDKFNNDIEEYYREARAIIEKINYRRFNTVEEAMRAFNESGIRKDFFYRLTRSGANNAEGYKIQLLTRDMVEQYKQDNNPYSDGYKDYTTPIENFYFDSLDTEIQMMLLDKGWTKEQFDSISQQERDQAVKCIAF